MNQPINQSTKVLLLGVKLVPSPAKCIHTIPEVSINQPINQPINQSINQPNFSSWELKSSLVHPKAGTLSLKYQSINQLINQLINQSTINQSTKFLLRGVKIVLSPSKCRHTIPEVSINQSINPSIK